MIPPRFLQVLSKVPPGSLQDFSKALSGFLQGSFGIPPSLFQDSSSSLLKSLQIFWARLCMVTVAETAVDPVDIGLPNVGAM